MKTQDRKLNPTIKKLMKMGGHEHVKKLKSRMKGRK